MPRPLPAANITPAAVFRAVEKWSPTVLIDEADTFLRDNNELRGILNSGHQRRTLTSFARSAKTTSQRFPTGDRRRWPSLASCQTLSSRAIHIEMRRKTAAERVTPLRLDRLGHLEQTSGKPPDGPRIMPMPCGRPTHKCQPPFMVARRTTGDH